jgi:hypothetical protein
VLEPDNVQVPVPLFVTVPDVVPIMLDMLPLPVPPMVSPNVLPVIVPALEILISPWLVTMLEALPSVIKPLYVAAVAELFVKAPPLEIPVPFRVSASDVPKVNPLRSSAAPDVTEVPEPVVPRGVLVASPLAPSFNVPALIVFNPV